MTLARRIASTRLFRVTAISRMLVAAFALSACSGEAFAQVRAAYLHNLSSFGGPLSDTTVRVSVDQDRDEIYVVYQNLIRVYNPSGMEIFSFGDSLDLGHILDAAVDRKGDIILLSFKDARPLVTRCNFRGEPIGPIEITGLPDGGVFEANRVVIRNGLFYFVSLGASRVVITEESGAFRESVDLLAQMGAEERQRSGAQVSGFTVDGRGNMFFTMPSMFKVFRRAPDGSMAFFGRAGSAPGRFGVVSGIVSDSRGNIVVADKLKCAVMVFDKDFTFLTEFGYRGLRPENLIVPDDVAIDHRDRLYVAQARNRGVSVFALESR
jgi:DNA-binding beta-propeller fold protein YncE